MRKLIIIIYYIPNDNFSYKRKVEQIILFNVLIVL